MVKMGPSVEFLPRYNSYYLDVVGMMASLLSTPEVQCYPVLLLSPGKSLHWPAPGQWRAGSGSRGNPPSQISLV